MQCHQKCVPKKKKRRSVPLSMEYEESGQLCVCLEIDFQEFLSPSLWDMIICCYLVTKSCLTLSDPMNCSPSDFSVLGISLARILEWAAILQEIFLTSRLN